MTVTAASFRTNFPEFDNLYRYPDSMVNFWLGFGLKTLSARRWDDLLDYGLQLFVAHELVLSAQAAAAAAVGGATSNAALAPVPGVAAGMTSGKSVDKVSVTYDTSSIRLENAGHFNLTTYGIQFYMLADKVGAGGIVAISQGYNYCEDAYSPGYYG